MTAALNSLPGDSELRDHVCTKHGIGRAIMEEKDQEQVQSLKRDLTALEEKLGERGRLIAAANDTEFIDALLGAYADPRAFKMPQRVPFRETREGIAFMQARVALGRMNCRCALVHPMKRMLCCDSCDPATLQGRAEKAFR
jgi:hypothetical protein